MSGIKNKRPSAETEKSLSESRYHFVSTTSKQRDAISIYLKEIESNPLLTAKEEVYYGRLVQQGNELARKKLITCNLRLVVKISRRYLGRGLGFSDLIEEGNLGLIHAVQKFDPEKGFRFSTYSTWWIRQSIERGLMNHSRTIRLPIHINKELSGCLKKRAQLGQKLGVKPSLKQLSSELGKSETEVQTLLRHAEYPASLDFTIGDDQDASLMDFVATESVKQPEDEVITQDVANSVELCLNQLEKKQCDVIVRRFGLRGHDNATLEQVGKELNITRERVRQIQLDALKRLKRILEMEGGSCDLYLHGS